MQEQVYDERYVRFFECFNQGHYFEAHEVLEALWLPERQGARGRFYQGLIQLAGAFVHLGKARTGPAIRLLGLARENLRNYPPAYEGLAVASVLSLIEEWQQLLLNASNGCRLAAPELRLTESRTPRR